VIQRIFIELNIGDGEVKKRRKLHHLDIDHIAIPLEFKYSIGEKAFAAGTSETRG
jgi:hypothetical protein